MKINNPLYDGDVRENGEPIYESPLSKEFDRKKLKLGRIVGRGEFGEVYEGLVRSFILTLPILLSLLLLLLFKKVPATLIDFIWGGLYVYYLLVDSLSISSYQLNV